MWTQILCVVLPLFFNIVGSTENPCGNTGCAAPSSAPYELAYYWRPYTGTIPCDALISGLDEFGNRIYTGQAYIRDRELLPGTIYRGCDTLLTSAYLEVLTTNENVQILCTNVPEKFKWVAVRSGNLAASGCEFVEGGSEVGYGLYIGRALYNGEMIVAKVFPDSAPNRGLWYMDSTTAVQNFEILGFNCP